MRSAATTGILWLVAALTVSACGGDREASPAGTAKADGEVVVFPANSPQLAAIVAAPVTLRQSEQIRLNGRLVWDEARTVRVFSPLGGRVVRLLAEPGARVKAGDPLAVLSSPDFGQAQAEFARARADNALAEKALGRARELHDRGIIATKDLQQAEADAARAAAERERTRARARLFGEGTGVDQQFVLRAPIPGVVVERNANPGQELRADQAQPGTAAPFVISDPTRLWVHLDVPETHLAGIQAGMAFAVRVTSMPEAEFRGRIEHVGDFLDPATRTARVRGSLANDDRRLKAEMFVAADLEVPRPEYARLPAAAVLLIGDTRYVFVDLGGGRFERRRIEGEESGFGTLRAWKGVAAGERVVVEGPLLLQQILNTAVK